MPEQTITLTWYEVILGSNTGTLRHAKAMKDGRKDKPGITPEFGLLLHIEGACAEIAVAKALNLYWAGRVDTLKEPDIGDFIQVRRRRDGEWDLILRPGDSAKAHDAYVLVTGMVPTYVVHGWLWGYEVMQERYWKDLHNGRPPAWFAPKEDLRDIADLPRTREAALRETFSPATPEALRRGAVGAT